MMKPSYAALLEALKRSDGMPVADLARELKMSYMGVKQHCLNLCKMGYLVEWRVPREKKEVGRPEKLYLLTAKCDGLFPHGGSEISLALLEGIRAVYGETAPEKMMFHFFQNLEERWGEKCALGGDLDEKARLLTDLREKEGWFSRLIDDEEGLRIEEFHNPLAGIYKKYPSVERMEVMLVEHLLGVKVMRRVVPLGKKDTRVNYELRVGKRPSNREAEVMTPKIVERPKKTVVAVQVPQVERETSSLVEPVVSPEVPNEAIPDTESVELKKPAPPAAETVLPKRKMVEQNMEQRGFNFK